MRVATMEGRGRRGPREVSSRVVDSSEEVFDSSEEEGAHLNSPCYKQRKS